jgi:hypothetical protein
MFSFPFQRGAALALLVALVLAGAASADAPSASADARQRLTLPPAGRDKVLAEMRSMLGSIGGIVAALAAKDPVAAEKAARASGMGAAADVDPAVKSSLPREFLQLGMGTHRAFDALADRIKSGAATEDVLRELAGVTGNCVTCHAAYRFDEAR